MHYDGLRGMLNEIETVTTLPDDFEGVNHCADIHVSPSGEFVYGSNRGHDSIAVFSIDQDNGGLSFVGHVSSGGETPRNFAIDPSGTNMLVANQDTGNILAFRINNGDRDAGADGPRGRRPRSRVHQAAAGLGLTAEGAEDSKGSENEEFLFVSMG